MVKRFRKSNKRGVAALIVTVAFALLFLIIVLGLTALSIREQRQSGDTDLSNRANAAAEAAIKEALNDTEEEKDCKSYKSRGKTFNLGNGVEITCRTITRESGPVLAQLDKDESKTAFVWSTALDPDNGFTVNNGTPEGNSGVYNDTCSAPTPPNPCYLNENREINQDHVHWADQMQIEWHHPPQDTGQFPGPITPYPTSASWGSGSLTYIAALELTFTYFDMTGDYHNTNEIVNGAVNKNNQTHPALPAGQEPKVKKVVLLPTADGSALVEDASPIHGGKIKANCSKTYIEYKCKTPKFSVADAIYDNAIPPENGRLAVSVTARYAKTHAKLTFYNTDPYNNIPDNILPGGIVPVLNTAWTIDVTARAGNVYRRLRAEKSTEGEIRTNTLDAGLFSGTDICKDMAVRNDFSVLNKNSCD